MNTGPSDDTAGSFGLFGVPLPPVLLFSEALSVMALLVVASLLSKALSLGALAVAVLSTGALLAVGFLLAVAQPVRKNPSSSTNREGNFKRGEGFIFKIKFIFAVGVGKTPPLYGEFKLKMQIFSNVGHRFPA